MDFKERSIFVIKLCMYYHTQLYCYYPINLEFQFWQRIDYIHCLAR